MTDHGFYTKDELKELDDSDLSFEIADAVILNVPDADKYLDLLIEELKQRNS